MNSNAVRGFLKAIIIVGVVFAITYFFSYNKWLHHDFNNVDITYKTDSYQDDDYKAQYKEIEDNTELYKKLYNSISYEFLEYNFGSEFYDIYYNNKEITDEFIILTGIVNLIDKDVAINCNLETEINSSIIKNKVDSLFGGVKYVDKSFTTKDGKLEIVYDKNNSKYKIKLNGNCSGFDYSEGGIKSTFYGAEKTNSYLYIYEKAMYMERLVDDNGNMTFVYHSGVTKDSPVLATRYEDVDIESLPTYVYKYGSNNGKIYLQEIVKK